MKQISIINAVKIVNQRVKPFDGEKEYLATGGLVGDNIVTEKVTYKDKPSRADLLAKENQLIVAKMKGTNKVFLVDNNISDYIFSTGFLVLEAKENWSPNFLFHLLQSKYFQEQKDKFSSGATQKAINNEKFKEILIPDIPLEDQKRIVKILDQAENLIQKRKQTIELLDEYLKSVFLEMFGDPITNPKNWKETKLGEIADICSGVTKGRKLGNQKTIFAPYMRVANVQDEHINLSEIKRIEVLPSDIEKYRLLNGDLLLTEGGDPDKLGRGGIWRGEIKDCIHQNHIFRVRLNNKIIVSEYLSAQIGSIRGKKYFLKSAKQTTGIATINITQLKNYPALVPPIDLQNKYSNAKKKVEDIKQKMTSQLEELENNFQSLMQKAFKGELLK